MMGLPQTQNPNAVASQPSSANIIFGIVAFFIIYAILHFVVNRQRRRVQSGLEKVNLSENPDRHFEGMM